MKVSMGTIIEFCLKSSITNNKRTTSPKDTNIKFQTPIIETLFKKINPSNSNKLKIKNSKSKVV